MEPNPATIKCRYYNVGFCKHRNECLYLHPEMDCEEQCVANKCMKRYRKKCINGQDCFYNSEQKCEFYHETNNQQKGNKKISTKQENINLCEQIKELSIINENKNKIIKSFEAETLKTSQIIDELKKTIARDNKELKEEHKIYKQQYDEKYSNLLETHNKCVERIEKLENNTNNSIAMESNESTNIESSGQIYQCNQCEYQTYEID